MRFPRFPKKLRPALLIVLAFGASAGVAADAPKPAPAPDEAAARREKAVAEVQDSIALTTELAARAYRQFREALRSGNMAPGAQPDPALLRPQYVAEWTRQFQPLVTAELQFIRRVARPTPQQYETIKAAGRAALQEAVKQYADIQIKSHQSGHRSSRRSEWPDARKLIQDGLAQSVQRTLSADQSKRCQLELEKRVAARKRVAILFVVAKLDKDLLLSAEQRDKFIALMNSNWDQAWGRSPELLEHGEHYFPVLPDELVLPLLSDAQKQIWNTRNKNRHTIGGWTGFGFIHPVADDEPQPADGNGGSP